MMAASPGRSLSPGSTEGRGEQSIEGGRRGGGIRNTYVASNSVSKLLKYSGEGCARENTKTKEFRNGNRKQINNMFSLDVSLTGTFSLFTIVDYLIHQQGRKRFLFPATFISPFV